MLGRAAQLAFVVHRQAGAVLVPRCRRRRKHFIPLGPRQSAAFSTRFLAIWLSPRTQYPALRQQLTGGAYNETYTGHRAGGNDAAGRLQ